MSLNDAIQAVKESGPTKNFNEQVDGFKISQFVIVRIHAQAEE